MVKHRVFIVVTVLELVVLAALLVHGEVVRGRRARDEEPAELALVRRLQLTDFALWTEARYTRHPSQADLFAPFEDFPAALEHFPAGSIVPAPRRDDRAAASRR